MGARAQAILPLALVIGVLSFLWTELALNFTFHWVTLQDEVLAGLGAPQNFHLILPTAFISWGLFFAAGGDNAAFGKVVIACVFGSVAALVTMPLAFSTADLPDFWGIALWVGIFAFILVAILIAGDWYYVAGTFPAFASVFLWWIATGLDGWVPDPVSGASLGKEEVVAGLTAGTPVGTGAALGLISTPWAWVWFSSFVTLICGCILGIISAKVAAAITPKPRAAEA
jgi:hypothetical protein